MGIERKAWCDLTPRDETTWFLLHMATKTINKIIHDLAWPIFVSILPITCFSVQQGLAIFDPLAITRIVPVPSGRLPLIHCLPQPHRGTSGKTCGKAQKRCRNWLLWRVVKKQNGTLKLFYLRICWEVLYQSELPGQSNRLISSLVTDKLWCWLISASDRHGQ